MSGEGRHPKFSVERGKIATINNTLGEFVIFILYSGAIPPAY
jgi:hypothetical protein